MREYNHKKIEKKWQAFWDKNKIYKTLDNSKKEKFYILDMFPYVSGEGIHVGHPKGYIATDVVSRMKRMQGFNVLHPMGFDSFGLPTENYAIKTKTNPVVSVAKNIARFKKQLNIIGFDYDWSREVNTSDPKFYKWTQWIFLKLLEKGLAYESNEPVNWCPKDKTVLANEDVEGGKCERCGTVVEQKPIRQWVLKITDYADRLLSDLDELDWPESIKESQRNWIGRSEGAEIDFKIFSLMSDIGEEVKVFTTRPDTIFGATYLVLAPGHELVKKLKSQIQNLKEVEKYIGEVKNKTEIERTDVNKTKTGVELKGIKAINPANGEKIPVWIADYVFLGYGTGAIMAVPAHDERDFEFAKKYNLEIKYVVATPEPEQLYPPKEGQPYVYRKAVECYIRNPKNDNFLLLDWKVAKWKSPITGGVEEGEDIVDAAKREIYEETGYKNLKFIQHLGTPMRAYFWHPFKNENRKADFYGLFFELENEEKDKVIENEISKHQPVWVPRNKVESFLNTSLVPFRRIGQQIQSYSGEGVLINSEKFNDLDSEKAKKEIIKFVGGKEKVTYKLRNWVFSRQRYWGEPIPVLRDGDKIIPVKEKDLPLKLPKVKSYEPTGTAESPLAGLPNWINVKVGKKVLRRESNTMPQWAGSSWYYLRYMDPKNSKALVDKKKEKYWNMVDLYVGGAEHATRHLIYARFWHKFLYDIGVVENKEPFKRLQNVGLIIASDGRKMSKRFGNIINPDDIISTYGADTLRMYEMFMGPFDQAVSWNTDGVVGPRRFIEKVWRIGERVSENLKDFSGPRVARADASNKSGLNQTIQNPSSSLSLKKLLNKTIKKVSEDIEEMCFNTAISSMMILATEMESAFVQGFGVTKEDYKKFLQILSPFAPHVAEELWSILGEKRSISFAEWPKWDENLIKDDELKIMVQVNGKLRSEMFIKTDEIEEDIKNKALADEAVIRNIAGKEVKKVIYVKNRLVNIVV